MRCLKALPHSAQAYGLSPVWVRLWTTRADCNRKVFGQYSHLNGFKPVWIELWVILLLRWANFFPHISHWYLFSLVCVISCTFSLDGKAKIASQNLHFNWFCCCSSLFLSSPSDGTSLRGFSLGSWCKGLPCLLVTGFPWMFFAPYEDLVLVFFGLVLLPTFGYLP